MRYHQRSVRMNPKPRRLLRLEALEDRFLLTTVVNLNDDGPGSLRDALVATPVGGQVDFKPGLSGTIFLVSGPLNIVKNLSIAGPGTDTIVVSGSDTFSVFGISSASLAASIAGLAIVDGAASFQGGGILNFGTLSLDSILVASNTAVAGGGGIFNGGTLNIRNSVITGNQAGTDINPGTGGGIMNVGILISANNLFLSNSTAAEGDGAGIYNTNTATLVNNVLAGNQASGDGGGLASLGSATLKHCTIAGNGAVTGGGLAVLAGGPALELTSTIVALNRADAGPDVSGATINSTFNLIGDGTGSTGMTHQQNGNLVGTPGLPIDPLLGQVQVNGGSALSVAILPGSPAIDGGTNNGAPPNDQRGFSRIVNGIADIGAYEYQPPATSIVVSSSDNPSAEGQQITLFATVAGAASGSNTPIGSVTFFDGGIDIGMTSLVNGVASLLVTLSVGGHNITAAYSGFAEGDFVLDASNSPSFTQSVLAASVTVVDVDPEFSSVNQPVTLTATVSGSGPTPTGTVTFFYDGVNQLGTVNLISGAANLLTATVPGGVHQISAFYSGDAVYSESISGTTNLQVSPVGTTTVLANAPNEVKIDEPVTLTATVTPDLSGSFAPGGDVSFFSDGQLIGTATLVGNTATLQISTLKVGTRALTAQYNGDNNFLASVSLAVDQEVEAITFFAVGGAPGRVRYYNPDNSLSANFQPFGPGFVDGVAVATGDVNGDGYYDLVAAATVGNPHVKVYNGKDFATGTFNPANPDASLLAQWFPYALQFNVGANVAVGDVNGDGFAEVITGATAGNPHVKVHRGDAIANGTFNPDTSLYASFFPYALQFNVGANVSVGDVDNDGFAEVVTGATIGNPHVKVYRGQPMAQGTFDNFNSDIHLMAQWFPYALQFNVGATIAVGDGDGDGFAEVITGASVGNPHVKVHSGQAIATSGTATVLDEFFAYGLNFNVGARVAVGDFDGDDQVEILTGASVGSPHYRVVKADSAGNVPPALFEAIPADLLGGIYVGA